MKNLKIFFLFTLLFTLYSLLLLFCGGTRSGHPLAIIDITPEFVCSNDNHKTSIFLSGKYSMAKSHIPGMKQEGNPCIVSYKWNFSGAEYNIIDGTMECEKDKKCEENEKDFDCPLSMTFSGKHAVEVTLTVINDDGETDTSTKVIGLMICE